MVVVDNVPFYGVMGLGWSGCENDVIFLLTIIYFINPLLALTGCTICPISMVNCFFYKLLRFTCNVSSELRYNMWQKLTESVLLTHFSYTLIEIMIWITNHIHTKERDIIHHTHIATKELVTKPQPKSIQGQVITLHVGVGIQIITIARFHFNNVHITKGTYTRSVVAFGKSFHSIFLTCEVQLCGALSTAIRSRPTNRWLAWHQGRGCMLIFNTKASHVAWIYEARRERR